MKRILVTGCNGYIGPHLIELLMEYGGFHVIGCDLNLFAADAWQTLPRPDEFYLKDFRDLTEQELRNVDSIVHLAAISNDPMGNRFKDPTLDINRVHLENITNIVEQYKSIIINWETSLDKNLKHYTLYKNDKIFIVTHYFRIISSYSKCFRCENFKFFLDNYWHLNR